MKTNFIVHPLGYWKILIPLPFNSGQHSQVSAAFTGEEWQELRLPEVHVTSLGASEPLWMVIDLCMDSHGIFFLPNV